jgi:transposase, IS30 family
MQDTIQDIPFTKRKFFTFEERKRLEKLRNRWVGVRECARILGRLSHTPVLTELARIPSYTDALGNPMPYSAEYAEIDYLRKQENKWNIRKLDKDPKLRERVIEWILWDKSPEQIAGRIKAMWDHFGLTNTISHETIYTFIYEDTLAQKDKLHLHLRRHRKKRRESTGRRKREKVQIKERTSIHERPPYIEARKEFWHFETDSVLFSKWKAVLSVQYERMTCLARLTKCRDKWAEETARALRWVVHEFDGTPYPVRSVTYDNGTENVLHTELIHTYGITTYFTDTYSSWQKGWVENLNWLIRQYLPRDFDFENISDTLLYKIQELHNNRPRKKLGYLTPNEAYSMLLNEDFTITELFPKVVC